MEFPILRFLEVGCALFYPAGEKYGKFRLTKNRIAWTGVVNVAGITKAFRKNRKFSGASLSKQCPHALHRQNEKEQQEEGTEVNQVVVNVHLLR